MNKNQTTTGMPPLQMPSLEEVRRALFTRHMAEIDEEDLLPENREKTAEKLAKATPEEREKLLKKYEAAYVKFGKRWNDFLAQRTAELEAVIKAMRSGVAEEEQEKMSSLEASFDSQKHS